ncbi:hypothetical protein [Streptomyces hawaiiensis]|nr:hypothetical protein [Streptomyces hawaiiensis]
MSLPWAARGLKIPSAVRNDWQSRGLAMTAALTCYKKHFVLPTQYVFVSPAFAHNLRTALAKRAQTRAKFLEEPAETSDEVITRLTADQQQEVAPLAEQRTLRCSCPSTWT